MLMFGLEINVDVIVTAVVQKLPFHLVDVSTKFGEWCVNIKGIP